MSNAIKRKNLFERGPQHDVLLPFLQSGHRSGALLYEAPGFEPRDRYAVCVTKTAASYLTHKIRTVSRTSALYPIEYSPRALKLLWTPYSLCIGR